MAKANNVVEVRKSSDVVALDEETRALIESSAGMEDLMDRDVIAIPFLGILQPLSPQVNPSHGKYIEGAKPGQIFDTVTDEVFASVQVIPCAFRRSFLEWVPRDAGGGFRGEHEGEEAILEFNSRIDRKTGKATLDNGNHLVDTRSHFVLRVREDGSTTAAVISMASTQTKKSARWNKMALDFRPQHIQVPIGRPAPLFAAVYNLDTVLEENKKGKFFGWRIRRLQETPFTLLGAAARFHQQVKGRAVSVDRGEEQTPEEDDQSGM